MSFQNTNNTPFGGSSVTDLDNTTPGTFINLAGTLPRYRTHTHQVAFFAEDRLAVSAKVSLVGGLRLDRYAVERHNLVDNTTVDRTYTPPSWRGGVVYSVKPGLSVYGHVATATDTIRNVISSNPGQLLFDPTTGRQVEAGVKQSLPDQRAEWTVAGYYIKKTKLVVPVPGLPGVSQQIGAQSSRGVEVTAAVNLPAGVRIDGNLAVLDARFDDFAENVGGTLVSRAGNTPPSVPERSANLWLTWTAPRAWQFRGGLRSVGRRTWDNANTSQIPGYTVVDAGIRKAADGKGGGRPVPVQPDQRALWHGCLLQPLRAAVDAGRAALGGGGVDLRLLAPPLRKQKLFVLCAVDADLVGQIRSGRLRWYRARWDGSVVDALRRLYTRVDVIGVENGSTAGWSAFEGTGADVVFNLALSAVSSEAAFVAFLEAAGSALDRIGDAGHCVVERQDPVAHAVGRGWRESAPVRRAGSRRSSPPD